MFFRSTPAVSITPDATRFPPAPRQGRGGFSLILSLTMMALLLLLAVGAAALLAVQMRIATASSEAARARLNALAGARIALGEIQRLLGPDRAVSANAAILASNGTAANAGEISQGVGRPRCVGVWRGLKDDRGLPAVSPVTGYASDHDGAFAGWLSSGTTSSGVSLSTPAPGQRSALLAWMRQPGASRPDRTKEWRLLDAGDTPYAGAPALTNRDEPSLDAPPEAMGADPAAGAFAWMAMDENQKARADLRIPADTFSKSVRDTLGFMSAPAFAPAYPADGASFAKRRATATARTVSAGDWMGLTLDSPDSGWFPTRRNDGVTPEPALRHDFTTTSVSLLTDAANGGLKRDIGLLALHDEASFDALAGLGGYDGLVGFEYRDNGPGNLRGAWWRTLATRGIPRPVEIPLTDYQYRIWPLWSDVREWANLATTSLAGSATTDGATLPFLGVAGGVPFIQEITYTDWQKFLDLPLLKKTDRRYQANRRQPVIAKYRVEINLVAQPVAGANPATYDVYPKFNMIVTLWNPYNVRMKLNAPGANDRMQIAGVNFPIMLRLTPEGGPPANFNLANTGVAVPLFGSDMEPGEFRVFSIPVQAQGTMISKGGSSSLPLSQGYSSQGGAVVNWKLLGGVAAGTAISCEFRLNDTYAAQGHGSYSNLTLYRTPYYQYPDGWCGFAGVDDSAPGTATNATQMLPALANPPALNVPVDQLSGVAGRRLGIFEYRVKSEKSVGAVLDGGRALIGDWRGVNQGLEFPDNTAQYRNPSPTEFVAWDGTGSAGPENPVDFQFNAARGTGYGGTGYSPASGLDHMVVRRIPLHPPVSLLSLSQANLGGGLRSHSAAYFLDLAVGASKLEKHNGMNDVREAFGNALQNPWVAPDAVVSPGYIKAFNYQGALEKAFDMSWIMNAALADTWFVSSLGAWDKGACATLFPELAKDARTTLAGFFANKNLLPDRRYEPAGNADAADFVNGDIAVPDSCDKLASALRVKGGFNINSTSVRAWRAFLASASTGDAGGTVIAFDPSGTKGAVTVPATGVSILKSDTPNAAPAASPASDNAGRVNGGVTLTDAQLDALARAMVREVKTRGPFLSVGEFLNRRLENGESGELGAVQSAIRKSGIDAYLATTGYALKDLATPNATAVKSRPYSGSGGPGAISQADLLRPLMSAVTARGDTFAVIVAGSASPDGAHATYEVTLRRTYDYLDTADTSDTAPANLRRTVNRAFGRRFVVAGTRRID